MAVKILQNALICDHGNQLQVAEIYFDQKIREIRPHNQQPVPWSAISEIKNYRDFLKTVQKYDHPADVQIFDIEGLLLIPGAVDPHVHFNTPGFEQRDDIEEEQRLRRGRGRGDSIDSIDKSKQRGREGDWDRIPLVSPYEDGRRR